MKKLLILILFFTLAFCSCTQPNRRPAPSGEPSVPYTDAQDREDTESTTDMTMITWLGQDVAVAGEGAQTEAGVTRITQGGVYYLSGQSENAQIVVESEQSVRLVLAGVSLSCEASPLTVTSGAKAVLTLAAGTTNALMCVQEAAIVSDGALTVNGSGMLTLSGTAGIRSAGTVLFLSGGLELTAAEDGVISDETIVISGGFLTVHADGCALSAPSGDIILADGTLSLRAKTGARGRGVICRGGNVRMVCAESAVDAEQLTLSGGTVIADSAGAGVSAECVLDAQGGVFVCGMAEAGSPAFATDSYGAVIAAVGLSSDDMLTLRGADAAVISYTPECAVSEVLLCFPYIEGDTYALQNNDTAVSFALENKLLRVELE